MATKKTDKYIPRLKAIYAEEIEKSLQKELGLKNINEVPKLEKVVVSAGVGKKREDKRFTETVALTLEKITGQAPTSRLAKKSIATFKIRKGMGAPVGYLVTLRNDKCTNSSTVSLTSLSHTSAISTAFRPLRSTNKETTPSVSANRLSSRKSLSKTPLFSTVSKSPLLLKMVPRKEAKSC